MVAHPGAVDAHPGALEAHPEAMKCSSGIMEAHPGATEPHPGALEAHPGAVLAYLGAMKANHEDVEAQPGAVEAQPGDMKAHPSAASFVHVSIALATPSPNGLRVLGNVQLSRVRRIFCSSHSFPPAHALTVHSTDRELQEGKRPMISIYIH